MKRLRILLVLAVVLAGVGAYLGLRWLEGTYQMKPYTRIEEGLFVGSAVERPPPGTDVVVNLCGREDGYSVDFTLDRPLLEGGKDPDTEWLAEVVRFIDEHRRAGRTVYVHCMAGMNRSGMVVTAYLMYEHGWGRDEALAFVQARRPQVGPNPHLMRLLADWERVLQERRDPD